MEYPEQIKAFGIHLKNLRRSKGFSQQALADIANIDKTTILRIENGRNAPSLDMLFILSNALEISFKELMDFKGTL